ncbi:hypothetical protein Murru_2027 [Allomuricauda ruestringensis DSM 13258]|uniref:Collagen-like protein n=1 Tax=Allomuricauda ruestringensis (strain DSM 13258 / CIP 107369 / LMG 19739 / B1) TaxID=886377 RepID=G2PL37_ALLRU|nr:collagen-like protein [Allomuricauda ruestringensis]AEM71066.1 hypothetical protein Murru_2027 [Allomuricauda ruestringensis DSM 13258]
MKIRNLNLAKMALYLFLGLSITLVSCSGEDGKDGINGEIGPQGPAGQDGADGQDGNANVVVSEWMQFAFDNKEDADPPTYGDMHFEDEDIPEVDINAFLENGGVALFYVRISYVSSTQTGQLPYQLGSLTWETWMETSTDPDAVNGFIVRAYANDVITMENTDTYMLRYVLIPANVAEETGIADKMPESFGEAAALLGLD